MQIYCSITMRSDNTIKKSLLISLIAIFLVPAWAAGEVSANVGGKGHEEGISNSQPFPDWLSQFRQEAKQQGISEKTLNSALDKMRGPKSRIIKLDRNQPEVKLTFQEYLNKTVTKARIRKARKELRRNRKLLDRIAKHYAVQPRFLVALWGMETDFGRLTGGFNAIEALATLAYDGRRSDFFRQELLSALKILDEGHVSAKRMKGSWAGAMGQMQFMPSTFLTHAVDFTRDGKKDVWTTLPDSLASGANYLSTIGWDKSQTWGREVIIPKMLDDKLIGVEVRKSINEWQKLGVLNTDKSALPDADMQAALIRHEGKRDRYFLVYNNFHMLMDWNRSEKYATAVGILADALIGY